MVSTVYKRTREVDTIGDLPGADQARNLLRIAPVEQDTVLEMDLVAEDVGLASDSSLTDTLKREITTWNAGTLPVEPQTPVGVENSSDTQIDPATEGTLGSLAAALKSNGGDTLQVEQQGVLDVSSRDGRNLGDVDVTALPAAEQANQAVQETGTALGADATETRAVSQTGAESLSGTVTRATTQYNLKIEWLDGNGGVVTTETVASGVAGGTATHFDVPARSPDAQVVVEDAGSGTGQFSLAAHMR